MKSLVHEAALVVLFLGTLANAQSLSSTVPTIDLGYVKYNGYQNATAGINYYRGIRFAAAPMGSLRWQKPVPIEMMNDYAGQTINATTLGPACYQAAAKSTYSAPSAPQGQSEDCLLLDVLVPSNPVSTSLPVMFVIHGGGYVGGSAPFSYPGDALVNRSNGNLIYVGIQYRLGLFGWLGGEVIAENGALNTGLLDQRAAMDWVQRNIRAFGGNPAKVTIWGGSAGGGSVSYQLIAGGGYDTPPFSAAIADHPWWQPLANRSTQDLQYNTVLDLAGCSDLSCLRGLSSETLGNINQAAINVSYPGPGDAYGVYYWGPVVDGRFIRDLPDQEFARGNFYKVPLITNRDAYEGYIFSNQSQTSQTEETTDVSFVHMLYPARVRKLTSDPYRRPKISFPMRSRPSSAACTSSIRPRTSTQLSFSARPGLVTSSSIAPPTIWQVVCRTTVRTRRLSLNSPLPPVPSSTVRQMLLYHQTSQTIQVLITSRSRTL